MRKRHPRSGNSALETALFLPVIFLFIVGMIQIGKITYTYYTIKKTLYTLAMYLAEQQGVNFCDDGDPVIQSAKQFALTGTTDGSVDPYIPNLTPDMISVSTECYDPNTQALGQCVNSGCGTAAGGPRPDYIVVSIPDGYPVQPRIPYLVLDPIPLKPQITVPFGGT